MVSITLVIRSQLRSMSGNTPGRLSTLFHHARHLLAVNIQQRVTIPFWEKHTRTTFHQDILSIAMMVSLMWSISRKSSFNDAMPFLFLIREVIESEYYFFTEMRMQTSCLARCTMPWTVCNTQNRQVGGKMFRQSGPTAKSCETQLEDLLEQHLKDYPTFEEQRVKQTFQE